MKHRNFIFALAAVTLPLSMAQAEIPVNVKCAIHAQQKARSGGSEYQPIYKRTFELCMLNAMPREQQTAYLIEKLKPYEAISPGLITQKVAASEDPEFAGTWVRLSPNHWVLQRD